VAFVNPEGPVPFAQRQDGMVAIGQRSGLGEDQLDQRRVWAAGRDSVFAGGDELD